MTRVHIAPGVVEVEASGATAEKLADVALRVWRETRTAEPASEAPSAALGFAAAELGRGTSVEDVRHQDIGGWVARITTVNTATDLP